MIHWLNIVALQRHNVLPNPAPARALVQGLGEHCGAAAPQCLASGSSVAPFDPPTPSDPHCGDFVLVEYKSANKVSKTYKYVAL